MSGRAKLDRLIRRNVVALEAMRRTTDDHPLFPPAAFMSGPLRSVPPEFMQVLRQVENMRLGRDFGMLELLSASPTVEPPVPPPSRRPETER